MREVQVRPALGGVAITVPILAPMPRGLRVDSPGARGFLEGPRVSSPPRLRERVQRLLRSLEPVMEALAAAPVGSHLSPRGLTLVCPDASHTERVVGLVELIEDVLEEPARGWGRQLGLFPRRGEQGMVLEGWVDGVQVRVEQLHLRPHLLAHTGMPRELVITRAGEGPSQWKTHNPVVDLMLRFSGPRVELEGETLEALLPVIHGYPGSSLREGWLCLVHPQGGSLARLDEPLRLLTATARRLSENLHAGGAS